MIKGMGLRALKKEGCALYLCARCGDEQYYLYDPLRVINSECVECSGEIELVKESFR